jgi:hypothetical protein
LSFHRHLARSQAGGAETTIAAVVAGITIIIQVACTPAMTTTPATIHRIPMTPTRMTAVDVAGEVMAAVGEVEGIEANQGNRIRRGDVSLRIVRTGAWGFT